MVYNWHFEYEDNLKSEDDLWYLETRKYTKPNLRNQTYQSKATYQK